MRKRCFYYGIGMIVLALGLVLNSQSGLGVSPIISLAYSFSIITGINFPNTTLMLYILFVAAEILIHTFQKQKKMVYFLDILQIPVSIVFTRFMKLYLFFIPDFTMHAIFIRILILCMGIVCTGVGAAMTCVCVWCLILEMELFKPFQMLFMSILDLQKMGSIFVVSF